MLRPIVHSISLIGAALVWSFELVSSTVWEASSAVVVGIGLIVSGAVAVVGVVAGAARWALRFGVGVAVAMLALGVIVPLSGLSIGAMALAGVALAGLAGTGMEGLVRRRPAADGPPASAVVVALVLLVAPIAWALASPGGLTTGMWAGLAITWATAVAWTKAVPGALLAARIITPVAQVLAAATASLPAGVVMIVGAAALARFAWTPGAKLAVHPVVERGTTVPIPPELAPRDVLDAAGIDDRGRRRENRP